jgi:hypothetical protein
VQTCYRSRTDYKGFLYAAGLWRSHEVRSS